MKVALEESAQKQICCVIGIDVAGWRCIVLTELTDADMQLGLNPKNVLG